MVVRERIRNGINGILMVVVILAVLAAAVWAFVTFATSVESGSPQPLWLLLIATLLVTAIFLGRGFFLVAPNEARVLQLFGDYAGTATTPGLRWANPFFTRKKISLRVRKQRMRPKLR